MKIAIIGPGLLPIPPNGWGAIESLIYKHYCQLESMGHQVTIFNSKNLKSISNYINNHDFDFIHLQFDDHVNFFKKNLKKPFCVTIHNGYILKPKKWKPSYYSIFIDSLSIPGIIALSDKIYEIYKQNNYNGFIKVIKNGTKINDFNFINKGNGKAICLGKIDKRKQQAILAKKLDGLVEIDFIGPIADSNFKEGKTTKYLGIWDRQTVFKKLTEYSCLILLSDSEASPLVTVEAMASGLSLVLSESASANMPNENFIKILPDNENNFEKIANCINNTIKNNEIERDKIRQTANKYFDEKIIINEYINFINEFILYSKSEKYKNIKNKKNNIKYFLSRLYFFCNHYSFYKIFRFLFKKLNISYQKSPPIRKLKSE